MSRGLSWRCNTPRYDFPLATSCDLRRTWWCPAADAGPLRCVVWPGGELKMIAVADDHGLKEYPRCLCLIFPGRHVARDQNTCMAATVSAVRVASSSSPTNHSRASHRIHNIFPPTISSHTTVRLLISQHTQPHSQRHVAQVVQPRGSDRRCDLRGRDAFVQLSRPDSHAASRWFRSV